MHSHLIGQPYFHYMYFISLCAPLACSFSPTHVLVRVLRNHFDIWYWKIFLTLQHQWPNYTVAVFVVIFNLSLICVLILILNIIQSSPINPLYLGVWTHTMKYLRFGTTTLAPPKVPTLTFYYEQSLTHHSAAHPTSHPQLLYQISRFLYHHTSPCLVPAQSLHKPPLARLPRWSAVPVHMANLTHEILMNAWSVHIFFLNMRMPALLLLANY